MENRSDIKVYCYYYKYDKNLNDSNNNIDELYTY